VFDGRKGIPPDRAFAPFFSPFSMPSLVAQMDFQAILSGAGWMNYDPTNQINAGFDLIPVAVARHPGQAIPLEGSWFGNAKDYLSMSVKVTVHKAEEFLNPSEGAD
jgi:hypothetical protein